jgi:hypothetical protein
MFVVHDISICDGFGHSLDFGFFDSGQVKCKGGEMKHEWQKLTRAEKKEYASLWLSMKIRSMGYADMKEWQRSATLIVEGEYVFYLY